MDRTDMTAPVTRGEMYDALETWAGALMVRMDAKFAEMDSRMRALEHRLTLQLDEELARHTNAILEGVRTHIAAIDDKYKDLPGRVAKLEAKVFAPRRKRRRS